MTGNEYKNIIDGFDVENNADYQPSGGDTYCNFFAQDVASACNTPLPTGLCSSMFNSLWGNSFPKWYSVDYLDAQSRANQGFPTIAITSDHVAVVRPNDGTAPTAVKNVAITQAGATLLNNSTIAWGWPAASHPSIRFYSWYD